MVAPPFPLVSREEIWPGELVRSSNGELRPLVQAPAPWITVHYTGSPGDWDDFDDTSTEARAIHVYSQHAQKPWEYNWIIDSQGNVVEYAGFFQAAHSAGENGQAHGVLLLLGIGEVPTEAQVLSFRQLVWWLEQRGRTDPTTEIRRHKDMPGAATICPGPTIEPVWLELTTPWSPDPQEDDDMPKPIVWFDERYRDGFMVFPSVAPVDKPTFDLLVADGARVVRGRNHRRLRSLMRMSRQFTVTTIEGTVVKLADVPTKD